ncbi:glycoside hydrolase family 88/105 protein [Sphingobacterium bovistauri]|uniref:glycoside hydrolase family 88/105 protein n=1 Tax=Sphingobacterium bovistauri TaxID=2781959 RepID=UPI001CE17F72|nr:glycoside hydrolase family 88 protein [Sphingobacterium bovistauri]
MRFIIVLLSILFIGQSCFAQKLYQRFADAEMKRFPEAWQLDHGKRLYFGYGQGLACLAMLKVWEATQDQKYFDYVEKWADTVIRNDGNIHLYKLETYNIDYINPGKILFPLYEKTKKEKYKIAIETLMGQLKWHPRTHEGGYWHKLIYPHQIWLDGVYMAAPFVAQYGQFTGDTQYYDDAVNHVLLTAKHTFDVKSGLYYHAWDESKNQMWANKTTGQSPNFWGRSIGWYFMAMLDVLDYIPENHKGRAEIVQLIQNLAASLQKYQDKDGLWWQVIDKQRAPKNYQEASVNAMFLYSYAKAMNKGYIGKDYEKLTNKLLKGIQNKLLIKDVGNTLTLIQCNAVAGLGGTPYRDGGYEYYVNERIRENDAKANGPFIMGCIEFNK